MGSDVADRLCAVARARLRVAHAAAQDGARWTRRSHVRAGRARPIPHLLDAIPYMHSMVYAINPHAMQHGTWRTRSCRSAYNMCTRENAIVFPCDSIRRTGQHREALLSALIRATVCVLYVATMRQQWHATPHKHAYHTVHTIATHGTIRTAHEESVRS